MSPTLLYIQTATNLCQCALAQGERIISIAQSAQPRMHVAELSVQIEQLMQDGDRTYHDLDGIVLCAGPGSYTGLRVGYATAKGLAYALNRPIIAVDMMTAMLYSVDQTLWGSSPGVVRLARTDTYYIALFDAKGDLLGSVDVLSGEDLAANMDRSGDSVTWVFNQSAAQAWRHESAPQRLHIQDDEISPISFIKPGLVKFHNGLIEDTAYCQPLYIQEPKITQRAKPLF